MPPLHGRVRAERAEGGREGEMGRARVEGRQRAEKQRRQWQRGSDSVSVACRAQRKAAAEEGEEGRIACGIAVSGLGSRRTPPFDAREQRIRSAQWRAAAASALRFRRLTPAPISGSAAAGCRSV